MSIKFKLTSIKNTRDNSISSLDDTLTEKVYNPLRKSLQKSGIKLPEKQIEAFSRLAVAQPHEVLRTMNEAGGYASLTAIKKLKNALLAGEIIDRRGYTIIQNVVEKYTNKFSGHWLERATLDAMKHNPNYEYVLNWVKKEVDASMVLDNDSIRGKCLQVDEFLNEIEDELGVDKRQILYLMNQQAGNRRR